jgi:S-adenosyl methyltransferase
VTYLAKEKGVTQFLDVGTGIPTAPNVHETAAAHATGTRVAYADNDPVIHAHANALLTGTGTTRIILADLRDPQVILAGARDFLDFTRPVALLLVAILHFIPDAEDPVDLLAAYRDALPPGSFLVLSPGLSGHRGRRSPGTRRYRRSRHCPPLQN